MDSVLVYVLVCPLLLNSFASLCVCLSPDLPTRDKFLWLLVLWVVPFAGAIAAVIASVAPAWQQKVIRKKSMSRAT